ncbi:MAG: phage major capsid protein [Woeseia sp.]
MTIEQLQRKRRDLIRQARAALRKIKDDMTEVEVRKAEREHDDMMLQIDEIDAQIDDIEAREDGDPRRPIGVNSCDREPAENRWFDTGTNKEVRVVGKGERFASQDGERQYDGLTVGGVLRGMILGPRGDAERRALSEGTDSAGGFTVPTPLAGQFIDLMRARSHVMSAGAQTVQLGSETLGIAKVASDPVPGWRNENASIAESDPTLSKLTFTARSLSVLVKASRELLADSANAAAILERVFAQSFANEVDRVALLGTGTAPEPEGVVNVTGINTVSMGTNGAAITDYSEILSALQALEDDNAEPPTAAIMAPRTKFAIAGLVDTTGQPLRAPAVVEAVPFRSSSKIPVDDDQGTATNASRIIFGDYRELFVGMREELQIFMLRERYADTGQFAFVAHMRLDVQVAQPEAFCDLLGIIPA